ncbi:hypothetical protein CAMGR0001_0111 [Campylobacter gracilis RM3268]|uniref:Uncharacterized protein n=1 Tax=Campylobacter gracilis RM3268 TaxID=553220 RepID=C8PID1_9BACT|nr:hypothetical protein CAMGR0001_0111 [Campylobacter gracilis RM3268]
MPSLSFSGSFAVIFLFLNLSKQILKFSFEFAPKFKGLSFKFTKFRGIRSLNLARISALNLALAQNFYDHLRQ